MSADSSSDDMPKLLRKALPSLQSLLLLSLTPDAAIANKESLDHEAAQIRKQCEEGLNPSRKDGAVPQPPLEICMSLLDSFGRNSETLWNVSRSQKETALNQLTALLEDIRNHLDELRKPVALESHKHSGLTLSETVLLEHSLRAALSRIRAVETWEAGLTLKGGMIQWGRKTTPSIGASTFLSIDLGQKFSGHVELETVTVRREGTGTVSLPLESADLLTLSQLWIKSERLKRAHFWLGVKPDENDPVAPRRWAFFGAGTMLNIASSYRSQLNLSIRHDRFSFWNVSEDLFTPGEVERNLSALELNLLAKDTAESQLAMTLRAALHWYADKNGSLRRLSLGRATNLNPSNESSDPFRVLKADALFTIRPANWFALEPNASLFRNVYYADGQTGYLLQVKGRIFDGPWTLEERLQWAKIDCEALPPVALHHTLFPGSQTQGAGITLEAEVGINSRLSLDIFGQSVRPISGENACSWSPTNLAKPHFYHGGALVSWTVTFSPGH